jgi:NTE family protein
MKIGLALGGGGAKGFAHIPYLQAIDELGIPISCIAGTSIGAIIGAFYAGGMSGDEMIKLTEQLGIRETIKLVSPSSLRTGLTDGKNIEKYLRENLPAQSFEELKIPLKISATDYWSKKEYVFETGDLIPAIRASISIPGIFHPYLYSNRLFLDGGIVNPVPFDLLTDADFIIAIDVLNENFNDRKIPGPIDALFGSYHIMKQYIMRYKDYKNKTDLLCAPDLTLFSALAFHKSKDIILSVEKDVKEFKQIITSHKQLCR